MECNICGEHRHKLYCTKCVKEGVRQQDYQHHAVSRKKDEAYRKVKDYFSSNARQIWLAHAERDGKKLAITAIRQEIDRLHTVARKERQRLENVKTEVATRKSNLASALKGIKASHTAGVTSLKAEISRVKEKRDNVHMNIAVARRSRCKEAADLLGLRRIASKDEAFAIAGIVLADLHRIRNFAPMYVLLGISHATHLLTLLTDYLSLKLPFEIIPPSRGVSYPSIRKSATSKPIPLILPLESFSSSSAKAWSGKKAKDIQGLQTFTEAISLLAWDIAWVLWTQQLWPPISTSNEPVEACHIARNLYGLVTSSKIGRISHGSTLDFLPAQEATGTFPPFTLNAKSVQDVITSALDEDKASDADGGGWDMVEGGEEVMRGEGWLKLNTVTHSEE